MKKIKLSQHRVSFVSDEDFQVLNSYKWCITNGYAGRRNKNEIILMHRFIMNTPKGMDTDHINGNKLDNRRDNLRICTHSHNLRNQKNQQNRSSIYKGVGWHKTYSCWRAFIKHNRQNLFIGIFPTELHAAMAYDMWAKELHGKYARLNFNCVNKQL